MLHLGIKVGPNGWLEKLDNGLHIRRAEVYLNLANLESYPPLFAWLRDHRVQFGFHISTSLGGGLVPNLATADDEVRRASVTLIRRALDLASEQRAQLVVCHPGSYRNVRSGHGSTVLVGDETPAEEGNRLADGGNAASGRIRAPARRGTAGRKHAGV